MFSLNPQITWLILPVVICLSQRRSLGHNQCGHEGRLVQCLLPPAATLCAVASLPLAPTMSAPAAAVSAADALPRGTTFEKVKRARDRLRGELSSAAHGRRRAGEKRNGLRAPAQLTPEPDEEAWHGCSCHAPKPAPAKAPIKSEPASAPKPAPKAPAPAVLFAPSRVSGARWPQRERRAISRCIYKLFRRLCSTISSADLHVEDLRVIRRELWKFRKFIKSYYKQFFVSGEHVAQIKKIVMRCLATPNPGTFARCCATRNYYSRPTFSRACKNSSFCTVRPTRWFSEHPKPKKKGLSRLRKFRRAHVSKTFF